MERILDEKIEKIRFTLDDKVVIDFHLCRDKKHEKVPGEVYLYNRGGTLEAVVYMNEENECSKPIFATKGNVSQKDFSVYVDNILRIVRTRIIENFEIWKILEKFAYYNELLKAEELETESISPSTASI